MDRNPTVNILSKKELFGRVLSSIRKAGGRCDILSKFTKHPLKLSVVYEGREDIILLYIWNVSHGGRGRDAMEYRIQLKGDSLDVSDDFKTVLFGWYEEKRVFAAFNAFKHREFGRSPSIQVTKTTLEKAVKQGITFQRKQTPRGQDIVVTFRPEHILEYLQDIYPEYHKNGIADISEKEVRVVERRLDLKIPDKELEELPADRKRVIQTINKKARDARFRKCIYRLYKERCAICGLQARLTEAAHIIPVKDDGSDELVNGILLCRNHHKAFDDGLVQIDVDYTILLNEKRTKWLANNSIDNKLMEFIDSSRIGEKIMLPDETRYYPKKEYLAKKL